MKAGCFYGNKSWEHLKSLPTNFNGSNLSGFLALLLISKNEKKQLFFYCKMTKKREMKLFEEKFPEIFGGLK